LQGLQSAKGQKVPLNAARARLDGRALDVDSRVVNQQVPLWMSGDCSSWSAAWAAANLAVSRRKGEQET
jgi:hypothetical protein